MKILTAILELRSTGNFYCVQGTNRGALCPSPVIAILGCTPKQVKVDASLSPLKGGFEVEWKAYWSELIPSKRILKKMSPFTSFSLLDPAKEFLKDFLKPNARIYIRFTEIKK